MNKTIKIALIAIPFVVFLSVLLMALFQICPPDGPWPIPPWCENPESEHITLPGIRQEEIPSEAANEYLKTKVEIVTPFSHDDVYFIANNNSIMLTRENEIYAYGILDLRHGDDYLIKMGDYEKNGVFRGGYKEYLDEAQKTGYLPWSSQRLPSELIGVQEFLFDHIPLEQSGRKMIKGVYTGLETSVDDVTTPIINHYSNIKELGANWITLVPVWFFFPSETNPDKDANILRPVYAEEYYDGLQGDLYIYATIKDHELKKLIREAHSNNLKVYLVPHIAPINYGPDSPRGKANVEPEDIDEFFESYKNMILHYAEIAQETGVELFGLGCELDSLTAQDQNYFPGTNLREKWYGIIEAVRKSYDGKLTYSAVGELDYSVVHQIEFWDALDYIGFEWYIPLTDKKEIELSELIDLATDAIEKLHVPLYEKYKKPIIFTEVGFEAKPHAWTRSYEGSSQDRPVDRIVAAISYEYLFQAIEPYDFIEGMFIWSMHAPQDSNKIFPGDMWWTIANDGNEIQHSIVEENIKKWYSYYTN